MHKALQLNNFASVVLLILLLIIFFKQIQIVKKRLIGLFIAFNQAAYLHIYCNPNNIVLSLVI